MAAAPPRYRAFISYAHADRIAADRLHRRLEGFHMPARLVGQPTPLGPVPARLTPIFRDRDELPAAGDLSAQLQAALADSAFLILISSPASARSKWVNAEVETFLKLHGRDRLLALIVATDPAEPKRACFPPALTGLEPIAADWRHGHDGERLALLKLVAGLTGVRLDDLVQRDAQRQARRARAVAGGASAVALAMGALAFVAVDARNEAQVRQSQAEGLVEYMLTDLRQKLEPVGRLEVLDGVGQRALSYYAEQDAGDMDADALGRRARAQMLVGEVTNLRGNSEAALKAFQAAAAATGELLRREPDVAQRLYDHAQSRFWVGFIAWQRRELDAAEREIRGYLELAERMVAIEPGNEEWQTELASAQTNLAVLLDERGRNGEAAALFEATLRIEAQMLASAPDDATRLYPVGQTLAFIADNRAHRGDYGGAIAARRQESEIYARMLALDPEDANARRGTVMSRLAVGDLLTQQGEPSRAQPELEAAANAVRRLLAQDPENQSWKELLVHAHFLSAEAALAGGELGRARSEVAQAIAGAEALVAADGTVARWRQGRLMPSRAVDVRLARAAGNPRAAAMEAAFRREFAGDRFASRPARVAWLLTVENVDASDAARFDQLATTAREKELVETIRSRSAADGAEPRQARLASATPGEK